MISPDNLKDYSSDIILVASYNYYQEIVNYLENIGCNSYYDIYELLQLDYHLSVLSEYTLDEKSNLFKYKNVIEQDDNKLVITHCELVLTEKCTLRCKDCANLMQYYQKPEDINITDIIEPFNRFLDTIDSLLELRLLSGEPFIYKDMDEIINEFIKNKKIQRITIYTNSTIVPEEKILHSLIDKKISVHMSNYGLVSRKINELKDIFKKEHITYYVHDYHDWYEVGNLSYRNYNQKQLNDIYKTCWMAKCYSFYRGKLYICPRAAHGERLGAFVNKIGEYVDFTGDVECDYLKM